MQSEITRTALPFLLTRSPGRNRLVLNGKHKALWIWRGGLGPGLWMLLLSFEKQTGIRCFSVHMTVGLLPSMACVSLRISHIEHLYGDFQRIQPAIRRCQPQCVRSGRTSHNFINSSYVSYCKHIMQLLRLYFLPVPACSSQRKVREIRTLPILSDVSSSDLCY